MIDSVKLKIKAGDGGKGLVAFRHEKYVPFGGPCGGDGGDGGSVFFCADTNETTLSKLKYTKSVQAGSGQAGLNKQMHGKNGDDVTVKVPLGTMIRNADTNDLLADITHPDQQVCVAKGGRGGKGNWHFASGKNDAPEFAQPGEIGEKLNLKLELRLLADAGLIGFPSVGKSTFLSAVSAARPKIADYPFTTLEPNIGVITLNEGKSFVLADMPGLIEGAADGRGLGFAFLKHISRCRVLIHVIDMSAAERNPIEDYVAVNRELSKYDDELDKKAQIVCANKMDMPESQEHLDAFRKAYPELTVYPVSTVRHEGLEKVLYAAYEKIEESRIQQDLQKSGTEENVVYRYTPKKKDFQIKNLGNHRWKVESEKADQLAAIVDFNKEEDTYQFAMTLKKMGIDEALLKAGAEDGDSVVVGTYLMTYHQ